MIAATLLAAGGGVAAAGAIVEAAGALADRSAARSRGGRAIAVMVRLGRGIGVPDAPHGLERRMAAAGVPARVRPAEMMAVKVTAAMVAVLAAVPLAFAAPVRLAVVLLIGAATGAFLIPDLWLRRRARRRLARASLELADVLDLLQVALEAGLPIGRALAEVGRRRAGVLGPQLRAAAVRVQLGLPRSEALARLRASVPLPEVVALTAAVERADRHGAPLAPTLAALALEARAARAVRLRERAAAAAPRIQLVVALLLVPAVLLMVAAGLVHRLG